MRVYVQVYDYFWSMTPAHFVQFCEFGMAEGYADANDFGKQLKNVPDCFHRSDRGGSQFFLTTNDHLHYTPLDWSKDDFREARDEVRGLANETSD